MDGLKPFEDWQLDLERQLHPDKTPVSPDHYARLTPQPLEVVEAWDLGFHLANVLKYIARAGNKPGASEVEDLKKAHFYLTRALTLAMKRSK